MLFNHVLPHCGDLAAWRLVPIDTCTHHPKALHASTAGVAPVVLRVGAAVGA